MLEEAPEVELLEMDWDERRARVRWVAARAGVEDIRARLMPAGAWCDRRPEGG